MLLYIHHALLGILGIAILIMIIAFNIAPFSVNQTKIDSGNSRLDIYGIPEIYLREWYRTERLWVRKAIIYSQIIIGLCLIPLFVIREIGLI